MEKYTMDGLPIVTPDTMGRISEEAAAGVDVFSNMSLETIRREQPRIYQLLDDIYNSGMDETCKEFSTGLVKVVYMALKDQAAINKK